MYWSRTSSFFDILVWALLFILFWLGGWLLSSTVLRLRMRERPYAGMGVGFLGFIVISDLLGFLVPLRTAFWAAAIAILGLGLLAAWRGKYRLTLLLDEIWEARYQSIGLVVLWVLFILINRGLTIFDEYSNLPIVGALASGDFPPHFYLDNQVPLYYHYGLHLFAASLVNIGGLLVWSAFDISRAFTIALTLVISWLWFRRIAKNPFVLFASGMIILFASGTRWMLLLLPQNSLDAISSSVTMLGSALETGPDLKTALVRPWNIESGSAFPFPFAFANGIFPPVAMALGGSGAVPQLTLFLLLLLSRQRWDLSAGLVFGIVLASLNLTGEYLFVMAAAGIGLAVFGNAFIRRNFNNLREWVWVFLPAFVLTPMIGGVLTGVTRASLGRLVGSPEESITFTGAMLRWPPALTSSHLGSLSIFDLNQLVVGILELGPAILLAPVVTWATLKWLRSGKLAKAGISIGAWIGFTAPLFIKLTFSDRDVSRIIGMGVFIWIAVGLPWIWLFLRKLNRIAATIISFSSAIAVLGGLAFFPAQLIAIQQTHFSYFIQETDARMSKLHWDQLNRNSLVLDLSLPSRPSTLFGLKIGHAFQNIDTPFPGYASLLENPNPKQAALAGYSYIYVDRGAWQNLTAEQKKAFDQSCVIQLAEYRSETNDFRRLFDISGCNG